MTPTAAMAHLRDLIIEHGSPWGVRVQSTGVHLTQGICPWDIGLTLQVDNPEQREIITQKIKDYVEKYATDLNLRKDDAGHAYFHESQGYRFMDERWMPTGRDQYPDHAGRVATRRIIPRNPAPRVAMSPRRFSVERAH